MSVKLEFEAAMFEYMDKKESKGTVNAPKRVFRATLFKTHVHVHKFLRLFAVSTCKTPAHWRGSVIRLSFDQSGTQIWL